MKKTVFLTLAPLLLLGCQIAQRPLSIKKQQMICHELLFKGWTKEQVEKMQQQNHWSYVDSIMAYRPELIINGYRIGKEDVPPPNLRNPLCTPKIPIIIPDSLKGIYRYYHKGMDVKNDSLQYCWMSPLLPSDKKNIYYRQRYWVTTFGEVDSLTGGTYMRIIMLEYAKYTKKGNKLLRDPKVEHSDIFTMKPPIIIPPPKKKN